MIMSRAQRVRLIARFILLSIAVAVGSIAVQAQGVQATVSGTVTDETGGVMPGAIVTIVNKATNDTRTAITDERGSYRFDGLRPSRYSLTGELQGFATVSYEEITVNVGAVLTIDLPLKLSTMAETITVSGEAPLIQPEKADLSTIISREQIDSLPVNGRNYIDFALLAPTATPNVSTVRQGVFVDVGSARSYETQLLVDGFWNTDELFGAPRHIYSQDAVQEFQVIASGGAAEYGRAIGGVISAVTKSGANNFSGSGFGYFRNKELNSQTVLEKLRGAPKSEFNRKQYGASLGGPIVRDKAFFFGTVERSDELTPVDNLVTLANARVIGLPDADAGSIANFRDVLFWIGKTDLNLNHNNRLQASVVRTHHENFGQRSEAFATRSRQTHQDLYDWSYQLGWQYVAGQWLHDVRGAYFPRDNYSIGFNLGGPPLVPEGQLDQFTVPRVTVTNVANFGSSNIKNEQFTRPVQVVYASSVFANQHSIKFGADVMDTRYDYYLYGNLAGTYTFQNLAAFQAGRYSNFTQQFGDPLTKRRHAYISGYVQDSWAATNRLTLNYGLRYDYEVHPSYKGRAFGHDNNNIGPRFAASYDLTGAGKTFLKGSAGLYYDRLFLNLSTNPFYNLKDDPQFFSATWLFGQTGAPVYPNNFSAVPQNPPAGIRDVWIFPDELKTPTSAQMVATFDHALSTNWALSSTLLYVRTWDQVFTFDRNLAFDDATQRWVRPDPAFRQINQYDFIGEAEYLAFVLEARKRMSQRFSLNGNVTFGRAYDSATAFFDTASDQRFFDAEWGPSADKPRVRAVLSGVFQLTNFLMFSGIYSARTGLAYDPRVGPALDTNGDGRFNDRTPTFARNSFRTEGSQSLDARVAWNLNLPRNQRVQLLLEAFNVFNAENVNQVSSIYGPTPGQPLPLFGQPTAYAVPRQIQLGARFSF